MAAPEPSKPLPLADLIAFLESRRVRITPREYLRLRTLLSADGPWTRPRLADAIAALMASRRDELLSLRRELRAYLGVAATSTSDSEELEFDDIDLALVERELGSLSPSPAPSPTPPPVEPDWRREHQRGRVRRVAVASFGLAALLVLAVALVPPVPKADKVSTPYGEPALIEVLSNDRMPVLGSALVVLEKLPRGGKAKVLRDGRVRYTPASRFTGADSFSYALEHWSGARSATIAVTVEPEPLLDPGPGLTPDLPRLRRYQNAYRFGQITVYPGPAPNVPWPEMLSSFGLLAFAMTAALYFRSSHRVERPEPLEWNRDHDSEERYRPGDVGGDPQPWLDSGTLNRLSQLPLYRALDEPSGQLDLDATTKASARDVRPELVFERRRETLIVLLLVDEHAADLAWNRVVWDLARGLRARGVPVEIAFFRGSLADLFERMPGRLHLPDLEDERWRHAVLIVSDGKGLRREDGKRLESLATWPHVVWLDLRETRFWDDSVQPASKAGLPIFASDGEGLLAAFDALLSDKGRFEGSSSLEQLRRRGALARRRTSLRGQLIEILAGAAPWAQACAMIQPVPLPLSDLLRRRFFPEQPPVAIGRLVALPGTRLSLAGLTFAPSVLALLRHDFATRLPEEEQEAVLSFLLQEVNKTEPRRNGDLPGIAHLAWQAHRERLHLESDPDAALQQLERLATTPVLPTIELALGAVVLPGRGRPSMGVGDYARIPLRRAPTTAIAGQVLAHFAADSGIEARKRLPWRTAEKAVVLLLAAGSLVLGGVTAMHWFAAPVVTGWTMKFQLPGGKESDRLEIRNASFSLQEIDATTGRATAVRQDSDARSAPLRSIPGLRPGRAYRAFLMSGGVLKSGELPRLEGPNGRVEIKVERDDKAEQPCRRENADIGLALNVCPPGFGDIDGIPSWREQVGDSGRGKWISIGIEFSDREVVVSEAASDLRTALLATGAVDRVYRIDVGGTDSERRAISSFETILDELAPYDSRAQILFWPAAGTLTPSSSTLAALAITADAGDGQRLSASKVPLLTPRGLVLPAIHGTSWIARLKELVSPPDSSIVLPPAFFERLVVEMARTASPGTPRPPTAVPSDLISGEVANDILPGELLAIGRTRTTLQGSEDAIRSQETNLGNWIADQMLAAFADRGAQVAFINAGALRLHGDIPAGSSITRRDLDTLLPFSSPLVLLRLDGATLRQVVLHATSSSPGSGKWLQIAGMAFWLEGETRSASGLSRLVPIGSPAGDPGRSASSSRGSAIGSVDLGVGEEILAVTSRYLADPATGDQDGYLMLNPSQIVAEGPDLKVVLLQALRQAPNGIAPEVEGRICIDESKGPCLAEKPVQRPLLVSGSLGSLRRRPNCRKPDSICWGAEPGLEVYWAPDESDRKWSKPFLTNERGEFSFTTKPGPLVLRAYKRYSLWRTLLWERQTTAGSRLEEEDISPDPAYEPLAEVRDLPGDPFKRKEVVLGLNVPDSAAEEIAEVRYFFDGPEFREGQTDPYYEGRQPVLRSRDPGVGFRVSYKGKGCLNTVAITVSYQDGSRPLTIDFAHCTAV
ncbi:MAG TPA: 5'-nucleotidase C-terminal domain-containing protein, partial [Thermoanaerobaculia bacterium]|nr:5'-nucleotidase C-terminal domain-containing protein [Thermoanaerobaculia bacterium]